MFPDNLVAAFGGWKQSLVPPLPVAPLQLSLLDKRLHIPLGYMNPALKQLLRERLGCPPARLGGDHGDDLRLPRRR